MSHISTITSIFLLCILETLICESRVCNENPSKFIQTRNTQFIKGGSSFFFNGFNSYWMMDVARQPNERIKISNAFSEAAVAGLTVCRTWAFIDGGPNALQVSPGVYNEQVFQGLDFVISEAKNHGIYLILDLVNNYEDYGGRPQYVNWARNAGISVQNDDDFYTNPIIKGYFKNHVQKVLTRMNTITKVAYKDDETIMAWELMNEPRCQVDASGNTITGWVQEMGAYVKSIDGNHLLGIGMEGFYGDSMPDRKQYNPPFTGGTDFIKSHLVQQIDFSTIHAYPTAWLPGSDYRTQLDFIHNWMASHWNDSKTVLQKPLIFSEFGKSKKDQGYTSSLRDSYLDNIYSQIYNFAKTGGTFSGGMVWQIMAAGMEGYGDGYDIVLSQELSTKNLMSQYSAKMASVRF